MTTGNGLVTNTTGLVTGKAGKDFSNTVVITELIIRYSNSSGSDKANNLGF